MVLSLQGILQHSPSIQGTPSGQHNLSPHPFSALSQQVMLGVVQLASLHTNAGVVPEGQHPETPVLVFVMHVSV